MKETLTLLAQINIDSNNSYYRRHIVYERIPDYSNFTISGKINYSAWLDSNEVTFNMKDSKKIDTFSPDNEKNISKIHSLFADYEQEIKAMDTSFHRLHSLDWGNFRSIYSKQGLLQKAYIAIFQSDVNIFSQISSQWLLRQCTMITITFDKIILMANGQSDIIAEGENYEANLLFCYSDKTFFVINSKIDSGEISVKDDITYISIPAHATIFDENGECRKKWKAEITIATATKDTTYLLEREYTVKKKQQ